MTIKSRPIDAKALSDKIHEYMRDFPNATARLTACRAILSMLGDKNQTPTMLSCHIDREKWEPCHSCDSKCLTCMVTETHKCRICKDYKYYLPLYQFCPKCGRPLTDEAWDELEKRLRG